MTFIHKTLLAVGVKNDAFKVFDWSTGNLVRMTLARASRLPGIPGNQIAVAQPTGIRVYDLHSEQWIANVEINV